jgi:glycerophosphoryl diester phosphodiesterase
MIVHHMAANDGRAPVPNSLAAVEACLDLDASWIEIDATALADSDYLLVHDPDLESETTGFGPVAACSAEHAASLRFRVRGKETTVSVPRLSQVVELMARRGGSTRLQVDFKNFAPFPTDEPLQRLTRILEPLGERALVSTNADWQLRRLRAVVPRLELGFDIHFYLESRATPPSGDSHPRLLGAYGYYDDHPIARRQVWPVAEYLADRCAALVGLVPGVTTFYVNHHFLCRSLDDGFNWAKALHRSSIKLDAWTLNADDGTAVSNVHRLFQAGVDQFTTNTPRELAAILAGGSRRRRFELTVLGEEGLGARSEQPTHAKLGNVGSPGLETGHDPEE